MKEDQLIKYDHSQLEKVKNLMAMTDKLLVEQLNQKELPKHKHLIHKSKLSPEELGKAAVKLAIAIHNQREKKLKTSVNSKKTGDSSKDLEGS